MQPEINLIGPEGARRLYCVGGTGTGKTHLGFWALSHQDYDRRPWVVIDFKREEIFATMRKRRMFRGELKVTAKPPRKPGIYLLRVSEGDTDALDDFLWLVHRQGRTGLFFDEGMMAPKGQGTATRAILTQGRSLRIPVIALNQRPLNIDPYFRSEAQYVAILRLNDIEDRKEMRRWVPSLPLDLAHEDGSPVYPEHHAYWYDARTNVLFLLPPVDDVATILDRIDRRAPRRLSFFGS